MASRHLIRTLLLFAGFVSAAASGKSQTVIASRPTASFGILPASVLRNESTEIDSAKTPNVVKRDWLGLVCGSVNCELRPIRLATNGQTGGQVSVTYPATGRRPKVKGEYTIALIHGFPATRATVPTYFTLRTRRSPLDAVNGSLGISLQVPGSSTWSMVPRWAAGKDNDFLTFYLESGKPGFTDKRQALGRVSLEIVSGGIKPKDVLIWAGDLDGDGKIDLITRTGPNSAQAGLQLWLSGQAKGQQLVGPAAELADWVDVEEAEGC